jgi:hypothetical protein
VNIVRTAGTDILLDDALVAGFEPIADSTLEVARIAVGAGSHAIRSVGGQKFSIMSYGYATYTSYFYPGGMNLIK